MSKYLYNGVELPALPEWDKKTYPYAYIRESWVVSGVYDLLLFKEPYILDGSTRFANFICEDGETFLKCYHDSGAEAWGDMSTVTVNSGDDTNELMRQNMVWANFDLVTEGGTVLLSASDPIPVTAPSLDPLSLWLGWKAGNWVARQRGKAKPPDEEKTPIAYLYNGVQLPDINAVWTDKETYPYAWMSVQNVAEQGMEGNFAILRVDAYQGTIVDGGEKINFPDDNASMLYALVDSQELYDALLEAGMDFCGLNEWKYYADSYGGNYKDPNPTWSSYDILNADGSVYLAASEPVPVYE